MLLDAGGDVASAVAPFVALTVEHPPAVALAAYVVSLPNTHCLG